MRKLSLLGLALLPGQVEAQERPGRMMLEAGLVGWPGGDYSGARAQPTPERGYSAPDFSGQ